MTDRIRVRGSKLPTLVRRVGVSEAWACSMQVNTCVRDSEPANREICQAAFAEDARKRMPA